MNYNANNGRRFFDVVKKHATSGTFLSAIVCTFIYLGAGCIIIGALFSFMLQMAKTMGEFQGDMTVSYVFYIMLGFMSLIFVGSLVIAIILQSKLLKVRSFFKGKNNDPSGLRGIIRTTKASYIYTSVISIAPAAIMLIVMISILATTNSAITLIPTLIIVLPIYAAEIAGMVVLYVFTFKGIRTTVNYAINAMNGVAEGKVSVFIIVMTIISLVSAAVLVLYSALFFIVGLIFTVAANSEFVSEFSSGFAPMQIVPLFKTFMLMPLMSIPLLISQISYVKLLFGFKKDMELAKKQIEAIPAQINYTSTQSENDFS